MNYNNDNFNNSNNNNGGYRPPGRFMQKFAQFMMGRYGYDQLSKFLNILAIILIVLSNIRRLYMLNYIGLALFGIAMFRIYSRNIYRRQQENIKYLQLTRGIRTKIQEIKLKNNAKKFGSGGHTYKNTNSNSYGSSRSNAYGNGGYSNVYQGDFTHTYLKCGCCGKELRVPKGIGTVDVSCPSCHAKTRIKS